MKWCMGCVADFSQAQYDAVYEQLSPSRKAHIDAFHHTGARRQSLAGELLLRQLLQREGIDAAVVRLPSGQPALDGSDQYVSISHCGDRLVCAVSSVPVGIDIEAIRPIRPGMVEKVCNPAEQQYVLQDEENMLLRFFEIWTAKEAWFKMNGTGITNLQSVDTLSLERHCFIRHDHVISLIYEQKR